MLGINTISAMNFAYIVIFFSLSISVLCFLLLLNDNDNKTLKDDDEYDKKILKSRKKKRCKNKQL